MRKFAATALSLSLLTFESHAEKAMSLTVTPNGSQPSVSGSANYFTGAVRVDAPFKGSAPARVSGATVTFEPGARSAWHTHPLGQTLIVTSGTGWVQEAGKPIQTIKAGDTVSIAPGVKHWHGATATTGMSHVAISETLDGKAVDWMEQVSEQEYGNAP